MNTDPIADMLTRIRNASRAKRSDVCIPNSKMKKAVADIIQKKGFVEKVEIREDDGLKNIYISLVPGKNDIVLTRKSKPGRRQYLSSGEMRPIRNGYGIGVVSTSEGIMTTEEAKERKIGGEYICEIY